MKLINKLSWCFIASLFVLLTTSPARADLQIKDWTWHYDGLTHRVFVSGHIQNRSPVTAVRLRVEGTDENKNQVLAGQHRVSVGIAEIQPFEFSVPCSKEPSWCTLQIYSED